MTLACFWRLNKSEDGGCGQPGGGGGGGGRLEGGGGGGGGRPDGGGGGGGGQQEVEGGSGQPVVGGVGGGAAGDGRCGALTFSLASGTSVASRSEKSMSASTVITGELAAILFQCLSPASLYSSGLGNASCDSFFIKAFLARMTPMLEVTVFRAEMDLVKANMLVLSDLTGALAGGERIFLESESLEKSEIEDEDVSEEIDNSEDVDDPDRKPSSSAITLSSQMDDSLTLSFPSIMLGLKTEMVKPRLYPLFTFPAY